MLLDGKTVVLFDLGETLVAYYRRGEFGMDAVLVDRDGERDDLAGRRVRTLTELVV